MSRTGLLLLLTAVTLGAGCGNNERNASSGLENTDRTGTSPEQTTTDPTNTAVNERDRTEAYPTPTDQSMSEQDTKLIQSIRQLVMDDQALSELAKNVKIVAIDGKVTLRGPVKSEAEKAAIAAKAEQVAGPSQVDNQLEIAPGN